MVQMYTIAGRQFGSHVLAMVTLGALFGGTALSMGGSTAKKTQGPPINASSPDEESFIKYVSHLSRANWYGIRSNIQ
ncbi:hypothetical protein DL98DRAFT_428465 [Cadophora sp. DSE1049]|nr:hypothetical protein DL98DRAFT_428465 [Cadophora sp. DSE1049]